MLDVFKIIIQYNDPGYLRMLFKEYERPYNTRSIWSLDLPKHRTVKYGRNSFRFRGVKLWNPLDTSIKCAIDLKRFKDRIRSWNGKDCTCQACILCLLKLMKNDFKIILMTSDIILMFLVNVIMSPHLSFCILIKSCRSIAHGARFYCLHLPTLNKVLLT